MSYLLTVVAEEARRAEHAEVDNLSAAENALINARPDGVSLHVIQSLHDTSTT